MKREKPAGLRSNDKIVKPSKKLKVSITSDDQSPSEAGQSKEANNTPVYPSGRVTRAKAGGKTSEATKSISNGKKTPGKREKAAEQKSPVIKSARKKGEISADNKGQKTLPEDIAEEGVTLLMHLSGENDLLNPEAETPQSLAPLSPETTGNQEDTEANADTTVRRETGRLDKIRRQAKLPETPFGVSNENGDAIPAAVDASKQKNTSSTVVVNGDKTLNLGSERELALQLDTYKTVKGKQGERRSISSLETEAPAQEFTMARAQQQLFQQQLTADQLVPIADRDRIGATNHCWDPFSTKCKNQIMVEILKNHPIINALTTTTTIPTIYIHQLWHTITYNHLSKSLKCKIDQQEVDITLDFFRTVLRLPNKTDNEHTHFETFPSQEEVFRFLRELGYDECEGQLRVPSDFKRKNLPQPWTTIFTILTRCTTGKETGQDSARLLTLQMLHGVILLRHIDYARLIWQELVDHVVSRKSKVIGGNKNRFVPHVRFIKLIIHGLMNKYQSISARTDEPHHHDEVVKVFRDNATTTKKVAMDIPDALLNLADKETDTYKKYLKSRVPMDRSQPAVPSQGTHKKPSAKLRKESKAKKTKHVPMDEDEEIDWDAAIDEAMEHVIKENIKGGEKERFGENEGGTSMTSLGNEERNIEDNEGMDDDDDDDDDDVRSYRWVRRNEKKQAPNPTPRRSTRTTSREPGVTVSVHEQPPSPPPPFIPKTTSIQKAPPTLKSSKHVPTSPTEPLIAPIPTPEPTTQELDEMSFVTVAQMKTVMSTAIAHVNEQIEKAVADHMNEQIEKAVADQFKKYLASQPTTSQPTTSSTTPHPNTSGPQHNYKDFEFEELKQMMLAHMLDQPELRNAKPALFSYLYRGADLERTCTTNVLRRRLHDDPDSDNH